MDTCKPIYKVVRDRKKNDNKICRAQDTYSHGHTKGKGGMKDTCCKTDRRASGGALKRRAIEIGPATVERTTKGAYDWADGGLRKRRREGDTTDGTGERRLRPRDPG